MIALSLIIAAAGGIPFPLFPFCFGPPCQHLVPSIGSVGLGQGVVQSGTEVSLNSIGGIADPEYQSKNLSLSCSPVFSAPFGLHSDQVGQFLGGGPEGIVDLACLPAVDHFVPVRLFVGRGHTIPKALVTSSSQTSPPP